MEKNDNEKVEEEKKVDQELSKETASESKTAKLEEELLCEKTVAGDVPPEGMLDQEQLFKWLEAVIDPDVHLSIVGMGLVYSAKMTDEKVYVCMTLTSPSCPIGPELMANVKKRLLELSQVNQADVELVWEPAWDPAEMASDEVKDMLGIW